MSLLTRFPFLKNFSSEIFLHSTKTAIACMIGIGISSFFHVYNSLWLILTIIVIMGGKPTFGNAVNRSYFYVLGTLSGASIACFTLYFLPHNVLITCIVIFFTALGFIYLANGSSRFKDAGSLGAITTITILISQQPSLKLAAMRVVEILGGILIALLVSKFFFPIHARAQLLESFSEILTDLIELLRITAEETPPSEKLPLVKVIEEKINSHLTQNKDLIGNCKSEISTLPFNKAIAESILEYEQRLYRSLIFLYQAMHKEPENFKALINLPYLTELMIQMIQVIQGLSNSLDLNQPIPDITTLEKTDLLFEQHVTELLHQFSAHEQEIIHTVMFCVRHLMDEISILQLLISSYKQT